MKRSGLALLCSWMALLLVGCSSPSAGGGGFEGETLACGGLATHLGRPLARASVAFVGLGSGSPLAQTTTDGDGAFEIAVPSKTAGYLEIRSGDTALARQMVESVPDTLMIVEAAAPVPWTARATLGGAPVARASLRIVGSTRTVRTDASGRFTLARTADASEWVSIELADGTGRDMPLPSSSDSILELPAHPSLLLDDFEGPSTRSALGRAIGSGWWYALTDSVNGGTSTALPTGVVGNFREAYATSDAYKGTSLSIRFDVNPNQFYHYAMVGVDLVDSTHWMDLSGLDSVTFMAKGSGTARLNLVGRISLDPTTDPNGFFGVDLTLPTTWTRMVVRKSDLAAPSGSRPANQGVRWATASVQTRLLVFTVKDSATIEVDSIVLHGPRLSAVAPHS